MRVCRSSGSVWVWRALDPPPLASLRWQLAASSGWLAAASIAEVLARAVALAQGLSVPDHAAMRAVHAMAIFGGVVGWILAVLVRAGPMFIRDWRVPPWLVRLLPWGLALGVALGCIGELGVASARAGAAVARAGDTVALALVVAVMVTAGAWRSSRARSLPMLARSPHEVRIFQLAAMSAAVATVGSASAVALALAGVNTDLLADAVRHVVTVGFISAVVIAMTFRLMPALETRALRWPRLRDVAFWTLLAAVVARTLELLVGVTGAAVAPVVALSGVFAWIAVASAAANLVAAVAGSRPRLA
jgi:hypothetical protein